MPNAHNYRTQSGVSTRGLVLLCADYVSRYSFSGILDTDYSVVLVLVGVLERGFFRHIAG